MTRVLPGIKRRDEWTVPVRGPAQRIADGIDELMRAEVLEDPGWDGSEILEGWCDDPEGCGGALGVSSRPRAPGRLERSWTPDADNHIQAA